MSECSHFWKVQSPAPETPDLHARCSMCGAERTFPNRAASTGDAWRRLKKGVNIGKSDT